MLFSAAIATRAVQTMFLIQIINDLDLRTAISDLSRFDVDKQLRSLSLGVGTSYPRIVGINDVIAPLNIFWPLVLRVLSILAFFCTGGGCGGGWSRVSASILDATLRWKWDGRPFKYGVRNRRSKKV